MTTAAYPALVLAIYGAYRVGRSGAPDAAFERARLLALGFMMALLLAVHWRLVEAGVARSPPAFAAALASLLAAAGLVGLHVGAMVKAAARARQAPASSP
jgi:hypothetical protein